MLKPLDIILNELDRCPNAKDPEEIKLVCTGCKGLIYEHVQRVAKSVREDAVYAYVDMFFEQVLKQAHHNNANKLLQRERLLRSAYLVYMRQALAEIYMTKGKAKDADRKSTRLNSSHTVISYAVFCLKKKKNLAPLASLLHRRSDHRH